MPVKARKPTPLQDANLRELAPTLENAGQQAEVNTHPRWIPGVFQVTSICRDGMSR